MPDMGFRSRGELQAFVSGLAIPESRKEVVLLELEDHVFSDMAESEALGLTRDEAEARAFAALGEPSALATSLVAVDASFHLSLGDALASGLRLGGSFVFGVMLAALFSSGVYYLGAYSSWPWNLFPEGTDFRFIDSWLVTAHVLIVAACVIAFAPSGLGRKLVAPATSVWTIPLLILPALALPFLPLEFEGALDWAYVGGSDEFCLRTIFIWMGYLVFFALLTVPASIRATVRDRA